MSAIAVATVRTILDDANIVPDDRVGFISGIGDFLGSEGVSLNIPSDPAALVAWGQTLNSIASSLFGSARKITQKALAEAQAKTASPKKKYDLSLSEYELYLEIEAEKTKSQVLAAGGLGQFPSSEVFVVDQIGDVEADGE
jgi:hypothetical protein